MSTPEERLSEKAKKSISELERDNWEKIRLTTSQIRKFLAGVNGIRNQVQVLKSKGEIEDQLSEEILDALDYLKIKLIYQCGREQSVRDFAKKSDVFKAIDDIGDSRKKFEQFCMYVEALVAYHKFEGGK